MFKANPPSNRIVDFDTEFFDSGTSVSLVSIGMVREDGERLYLLHPEFDAIRERVIREAPDTWVLDNIFNPDVLMKHDPRIPLTVKEMAHWVADFVGKEPILCAYCGAYDMVATRSMFGRMVDSPEGWPYTHLDLAVPLQLLGKRSRDFPQMGDELPEHNALADALWTQRVRKTLLEESSRADGMLNRMAANVYLNHVPR